MNLINWKDCEKEFVRKVKVDSEKIKSIIETAEKRQQFIKTIPVTSKNVSFVVEGYYEVIKELLNALILQNGLKSKNHQCLITYFYKNYPNYEFEVNLISQMSYFRNRLNYYGESIKIEFYNKNKNDFERIIMILKEILK